MIKGRRGYAGHDIRGTLIGVALGSDGITVKTVDLHEKAQIDKVLEVAYTINFLGRTFPADIGITDSVIELKSQFDQIDWEAIKDLVDRANCDAVKAFFDTHLGRNRIPRLSEAKPSQSRGIRRIEEEIAETLQARSGCLHQGKKGNSSVPV